MFGIGLPEMILILALALIVVGPEKLPDLARSVAKGVMDLKKTAEALKKNLSEGENPFNDIKDDLDQTTRALGRNLLESDDTTWKTRAPRQETDPAADPIDSRISEAEFTAIDPDADGPKVSEKIDETTAPARSKNDPSHPPAC